MVSSGGRPSPVKKRTTSAMFDTHMLHIYVFIKNGKKQLFLQIKQNWILLISLIKREHFYSRKTILIYKSCTLKDFIKKRSQQIQVAHRKSLMHMIGAIQFIAFGLPMLQLFQRILTNIHESFFSNIYLIFQFAKQI